MNSYRLLVALFVALFVVSGCGEELRRPESRLVGTEIPFRLIAEDLPEGDPWSVAIASSDEAFTRAGSSVNVDGVVDSSTEVVLVFNPPESTSCPYAPIEGVRYDPSENVVFPIVPRRGGKTCTSDARQHRIIVAVARADLPAEDFRLWISSPPGPPQGVVVPVVDVDTMTFIDGTPHPQGHAEGIWVLSQITHEGVVLPELSGLVLDIDEDGSYGASGACNQLGGKLGTPSGTQTMAGCDDQRESIDALMFQAFGDGGHIFEDTLTFDVPSLQLVYIRTVEPSPEELFSVLLDDSAVVEFDELPAAGLDDGGPSAMERIVEIQHASDARFFVGIEQVGICLLVYAEFSAGSCSRPLNLAMEAWVRPLSGPNGPVGINYVFLPDTVLDDPKLQGLGDLEGNVLVVPDEKLGTGPLTLTTSNGSDFTLQL